MIKLKTEKKYELPYEDGDESFKITWIFPLSTSAEMDKLRDQIIGKGIKVSAEKIMSESIKAQEGFIGEDGKPLDVSQEVVRMAIFDYVKSVPEYYQTVMTAFLGPRSKNLLAGAMRQLTGSGNPENVSPASENSPV